MMLEKTICKNKIEYDKKSEQNILSANKMTLVQMNVE